LRDFCLFCIREISTVFHKDGGRDIEKSTLIYLAKLLQKQTRRIAQGNALERGENEIPTPDNEKSGKEYRDRLFLDLAFAATLKINRRARMFEFDTRTAWKRLADCKNKANQFLTPLSTFRYLRKQAGVSGKSCFIELIHRPYGPCLFAGKADDKNSQRVAFWKAKQQIYDDTLSWYCEAIRDYFTKQHRYPEPKAWECILIEEAFNTLPLYVRVSVYLRHKYGAYGRLPSSRIGDMLEQRRIVREHREWLESPAGKNWNAGWGLLINPYTND
jgi:hypothetical protein